MSKIKYNLIQTGSQGNCLILNGFIALDMGITFKKLKPFYKDLKIVFISHIHADHFNKRCVKMLARERPTLRFAVGKWLVPELLKCEVPKENIDVIDAGQIYDYKLCRISPVVLYHDVPNFGLRVFIENEKAIYITDTRTVDGIKAKNYQWYFLEANYTEDDLEQRIIAKTTAGQYCYELHVAERHLSKEQADEWLLQNMGANGRYEYLHGHIDKSDDWGYE